MFVLASDVDLPPLLPIYDNDDDECPALLPTPLPPPLLVLVAAETPEAEECFERCEERCEE